MKLPRVRAKYYCKKCKHWHFNSSKLYKDHWGYGTSYQHIDSNPKRRK